MLIVCQCFKYILTQMMQGQANCHLVWGPVWLLYLQGSWRCFIRKTGLQLFVWLLVKSDGGCQTLQLVEALDKVVDRIQNTCRVGPKFGFEELIVVVLYFHSVDVKQ
jgi:hypothetical protein